MYAIKMNDDKSLITTIKATIYQHEKNADTLVFLLPQTYEQIDLANCTTLIRYILPNGVGKSEELEMDPEPYKTYYKYRLKITSSLTNVAGKIELWLSSIDLQDNLVFRSGAVNIEILPSKDISDYFSDEDMDQLDKLNTKIAMLEQNKADSIVYNGDEKQLQLTANGALIGSPVDMKRVSEDVAEEIIGFDDKIDEEDDEIDDPDKVIHF